MMQRLAQAIGLPTLQVVIDDFIAALRQHPLFAAMMSQAEPGRLRRRLIAFWYAALDGESYRLPSEECPPLRPLSQDQWRVTQALFGRAINRHVPAYLAKPWQQRLEWFGQSLPLSGRMG
ncbi:hypothetical protein IGB42_03080 [Andreprevotia sp. IGB-42]|uniref:hypothetical protein n=1 Tax=Andreprevotia sp. IGB-42 TaxID=2497473 RepID=UPI001356D162|nr:hypothetical protein [Andreprevotia sp. IGB-42]KAF0812412.1 hypothetical protein IGB42_03080 [Andreprevotia sp. IGB-42]